MKLALIDLGSNSARMSMAEKTDDGFCELFRRRQMVRLSEGMDQDGLLKEDAQRRTIAALSDFAKEAASHHAAILAVTTAAVRRAKNGPAFCERVLQETKIPLTVISGKMEAQFDFYGVLASLPEEKDLLIADVGGGSTELILVKEKELQGKISLPFGAMVLTDRFGSDLDSATAQIRSLCGEVGLLEQAQGFPVIGLGGSAGALPYLDANLQRKETMPTVHGYTLTPQRLTEILGELQKRTPAQRVSDLQLEKGRADTICAGILPFLHLLTSLESPYLKVCTAGLREGILARLSAKGEAFDFANPDTLLQEIL